MPVVEIIRGKKTDEDAVAKAMDFTLALRKPPIVVNDGRGFFTSRVFTTYVNEGMALLKEGVEPALIENAGKMAGMPVGPLAVADEVSLDLIYHILKQNEADLASSNQSAAAIVSTQFVQELKRLGRKSGGGFYDYLADGKKVLWPKLATLFPKSTKQPDINTVIKRLLFVQVLEAARAWQDGIVTDPLEGDIGSILGIGFPPFTGGIFTYIDQFGIAKFVEEASEFAKKLGEAFAVPEILKKMASAQQTFYPKEM